MRVAIIGAGLQCRRRAPVVKEWKGAELAVIDSLHLEHAKDIAGKMGCEASADWKTAVARKDVDAVVVCTPPHVHAEISIAAMRAGKHVLCEKPLTRTVAEAEEMVKVAKETGRVLKCGFNHRHHPAIWEAKKIVDRGGIGKPLFARCRYGICGRPGYEKEWRADPKQAAGGQFIEQGTHAIDLFRWFMGDIVEVACMTGVQYFKEQTLDDNGMAIFRTASGAMASLHASLTQWKNLFSFRGVRRGRLRDRRGPRRELWQRAADRRQARFRRAVPRRRDRVPRRRHFLERGVEGIRSARSKGEREPMGNGHDGLAAMRVALAAYEAEKTGRIVRIK